MGAPARLPHPGRPDAHPPPALHRRLGPLLRRSPAVPARPHRQPAAQDRAGRRTPAHHPHRARGGLPPGAAAMSPPGQALGRRALWLGWPLWLRWLFWLAILALVTVVLVAVRTNLDQAHVTLIYLVVVLGGSASGGRALGIFLACASFLVIDYYLQTPYG